MGGQSTSKKKDKISSFSSTTPGLSDHMSATTTRPPSAARLNLTVHLLHRNPQALPRHHQLLRLRTSRTTPWDQVPPKRPRRRLKRSRNSTCWARRSALLTKWPWVGNTVWKSAWTMTTAGLRMRLCAWKHSEVQKLVQKLSLIWPIAIFGTFLVAKYNLQNTVCFVRIETLLGISSCVSVFLYLFFLFFSSAFQKDTAVNSKCNSDLAFSTTILLAATQQQQQQSLLVAAFFKVLLKVPLYYNIFLSPFFVWCCCKTWMRRHWCGVVFLVSSSNLWEFLLWYSCVVEDAVVVVVYCCSQMNFKLVDKICFGSRSLRGLTVIMNSLSISSAATFRSNFGGQSYSSSSTRRRSNGIRTVEGAAASSSSTP